MGIRRLPRLITVFCGASLLLCTGAGISSAEAPIGKSRGQTLYAGAFSYVPLGARGRRFPITPRLIVRNTDLSRTISVTSVEYRNSRGEHHHELVKTPIVLEPLASRDFTAQDPDKTAGHSPSFIVRWKADEVVNAPVVEVLMFGTAGVHGTSMTGRAWVLEEADEPEDRSPNR